MSTQSYLTMITVPKAFFELNCFVTFVQEHKANDLHVSVCQVPG